MFELQKRVESFLTQEITVENVVALLHLASEARADDLEEQCIVFLMQNIYQVVRLDDFERFREWAGLEALSCLSKVLGPEWEASLRTVVQQAKAVQEIPLSPPDSPLVKSLRENPSCPKQLNLVAETEDQDEPMSEDHGEESIPIKRAHPIYSDDFSDRSEGVC